MAELNKGPEIEKLDERPDVPEVFQDAFKPEHIKPRTGLGTREINIKSRKKESFIIKAIKFGRRFFKPYDPKSKPPDGFPRKAF